MALQVWLPLTKDLRQQGLSNVTVTNNGATFNSAGKLGGCYSFAKNAYIDIPASSMTSFTNGASVSFWIKINSWNTNWDTIFQAGLGTTPWTSYTFGILRNQANYLCFCISNGSSYTSSSCKTGDLTLGQWYHLTMAYKTGHILCYVNGSLVQDFSTSIVPNFSSITSIKLGGLISNYKCDCLLNDFRIYDHCLSPMEVKKLSQGLVLHYPLNRNGWGQENLLPISGSTIINSTQSFEFQGWVQNFYTKTWMNEHLTPGKQYTLSYTVTCLSIPDSNYTFKENRASPILVHQGNGWSQITTTSDGIKDTNMSVGQSRDYKCTFTFATASETYEYYGLCGYTALYRDASNNQQYARFRIDNLKLEEGSIVTPWCPNSSDALATTMGLNSTIEYDCSGFCNNGTRTGTFSWTSDTPKYQVSTKFSGSTSVYIQMPIITLNWSNVSFAAWGRWDAFNYWSRIFDFGNGASGSDWDICLANYGSNAYPGLGGRTGGGASWPDTQVTEVPLTAGQWYHFVETLEGKTCKLYVNGVLKKTITLTNSPTITTMNRNYLGLSNWSSNGAFKGGISDFRLYATALSANDVKSLYQNCATIDADGTIHGQIRS